MASLGIDRGWALVSLVRSVQYVPPMLLSRIPIPVFGIRPETSALGCRPVSVSYLRAAMVIA